MSSLASRSLEITRDALTARLAAPYSRLFILGDAADWSLTEDAKELNRITSRLGIPSRVVKSGSPKGIIKQVIFSTSQWFLPKLLSGNYQRDCRLTFAYFHGRPSPQNPEFLQCLEAFRTVHPQISRVQVANHSMRDFLANAGIPDRLLVVIPIGVNLEQFQFGSSEIKHKARAQLGIPTAAQVIGSFQKDGIGWGDGLEPKLIKGPDTFLKVLEQLRPKAPGLFALLSGPSRGYVKRGLEALGIPYQHVYLKEKADVAQLYQAADLTLVTSRDEGGPKAVLESMASGVPLVTTRVGQAADLVINGVNGWITEVDDVEHLAHCALKVLNASPSTLQPILDAARGTAQANSYAAQDELWARFFSGIVER